MRTYPVCLKVGSALWIILLLVTVMASSSYAQTNGRVIYDRKMLLDYGVYRPADLIELLPGWSTWSIDGFTNHVSASGLSNYSQERWVLFVDNRRIERGLIGLLDLNLLPIAVHQIDSVEVFTVPTTIAGQWVGQGAIHIFTTRDGDGIDLGGSMYTGNEINDPGPFLYTDYRTQNIDRIGPDGNGYLHLAKNGFYVSASALYREHHTTDEYIGYRTRERHDNNNHSPRKLLFTPLLRAGFVGGKTDVDLVMTQAVLNDFAFIPGYGAELPMQQTYTSLSAQGSFAMGEFVRFKAGVTATEDFLHGRDNLIAWDPNLKTDALRARVGWHIASAAWSLEFGGGLDLFRARPFYDNLISDQYRVNRGYVNTANITPRSQTHLSTEISQVAGSLLPKIHLNHRWKPISLNASFSRNSILEHQSFWYWMKMGYKGFSTLTPNLTDFDKIEVHSMATADLELTLLSSESARLSTSMGLRYTQNDWATISSFTYLPEEVRFMDDLRLVSDLGGMVAVANLYGRLRTVLGFEHELYGGIQSSIQGGEIFRELSREVSKLRAFYGIRYVGTPGFTLSGRFNVNSSTEWSAFYGTSRSDTPFYSNPVVPTQMKLNLYARKTIFNERAWAALKFENVLNRSLQDWPAGEVRDMTFHISIGASLKKRSNTRYFGDPFERPVY